MVQRKSLQSPRPARPSPARPSKSPRLCGPVVSALALSAVLAGCVTTQSAAPGYDEGALYGRFLAGVHAENLRDAEYSSHYFKAALSEAPDDPVLIAAAVRNAVDAGDVQGAAALAEAGLAAGVQDDTLRLVAAVDRFAAGDLAAARVHFDAMRPGAALTAVASVLAAWRHAAAGDESEAADAMGAVRQPYELAWTEGFQRALLHEYLGQTEQARQIAVFQAAQTPMTSLSVLRHGALLERLGETQTAADLYGVYLARDPAEPPVEAALERVLAGAAPPKAPSPAEASALHILHVAGALAESGSLRPASDYAMLALRLDPDFDAALMARGALLGAEGRHEQAMKTYSAVPETSIYWLSAQSEMTWTLVRQERQSEAMAFAEERARLDGSPASRSTLGDLLSMNKRYAEAEQVYGGLIEDLEVVRPEHWTLFFARAVTRERQGAWDGAEQDLLRAKALSPDQPEVLNYLGYSWIDQGVRVEEGLDMVRRAAALRPRSGAILDSVGWGLYRLGRFAEAVAMLERAVELEPASATINDHLGDVYWRLGRRTEAQFQWRRALSLGPESHERAAIETKLTSGLPKLADAADTPFILEP